MLISLTVASNSLAILKKRGDLMQLFMIFSLVALSAGALFAASRLTEPEVQPVKIRVNEPKR